MCLKNPSPPYVAGQRAGLNLCSDNKRYTDWKGCYAHPRTLGREDLALESKHHFARKFRFDPEMFSSLDRAVEGKY